jgi:predicted nucleotidyltransferase component of viral defense system
MQPFTRKPLVPDIALTTLSMKEAIAEKLRAALTRVEPAIRDFFDIDYLATRNKMDLNDQHLSELLAEKLKVPGNPPIDMSPARKEKLKTQINTELKPVLRPEDFESFELDRALDIVARTSYQYQQFA